MTALLSDTLGALGALDHDTCAVALLCCGNALLSCGSCLWCKVVQLLGLQYGAPHWCNRENPKSSLYTSVPITSWPNGWSLV